MQHHRNQLVWKSSPRQRSHRLVATIASMTTAIPTMIRKPKKGTMMGEGRWSAGKSLRPCTVPWRSWVKMRLPSSGIATT